MRRAPRRASSAASRNARRSVLLDEVKPKKTPLGNGKIEIFDGESFQILAAHSVLNFGVKNTFEVIKVVGPKPFFDEPMMSSFRF